MVRPQRSVSNSYGVGAAALPSMTFTLTLDDFKQARARIGGHIKHTPLLTSRQLSERTGFDVRLKAEMFQRVGSYKIRGNISDRKSTRLNSSHVAISYAVFCLKKKKR